MQHAYYVTYRLIVYRFIVIVMVCMLQVCHWVHILKTAWQTEGFFNKMSVFVKGPGWAPGKPRLGFIEDIPDVSFLCYDCVTFTVDSL